jgi:two-component system, response regulator FlrC
MNAMLKPTTPQLHAPRILVVEDDAALREAIHDTLRFAGYTVELAPDAEAALQSLARHPSAMVLSDVQLPGMDGHALLHEVRAAHPEMPVVLMTAHGSIQHAVAAMREGASDYLPKPFAAEALIALVARLARAPAADEDAPVAGDARTRELVDLARRIARTEVTVLITGESGTGKEVFARWIHRCSPRRQAPFVAINCAAIPEHMLEAVLFGHERGAFTGATQAHAGKFEQAQHGTLLLDEVSEMPLALQAKLLRVLQEREVERIGSRAPVPLDVRVLATSNRQLREEVTAGRFREDLYYRLNVMPLRLPALRDRTGDVLPLARRALARLAAPGTPPLELSADAERRLLAHAWPGNVRELDNLMQRAAVLATGRCLLASDLVFEGGEGMALELDGGPAGHLVHASEAEANEANRLAAGLTLHERDLILQAITACGSRKRAAAHLGISPRTLRHKLQRLRERGHDLPRARETVPA